MAAIDHRRTLRALLTAALLLTATSLAACSSDDPSAAPESTTKPQASGSTGAAPESLVQPVGTYEVRHSGLTLVDETRTTKAHGGVTEKPERTLRLDVWYPEVPEGAQVPLVVFSHGSTRRAVHYEATLKAWASAGYVVVGPDFPLSKEGTPGGTDYGGLAEQAGDVSFVIDEVLAMADDPEQRWAELVDPDRVGLGGQSFGAITSVAVAINPCCTDPRVGAITEFAGAWTEFGSDAPVPTGDAPPALIIHGAADPTVAYARGTELFDMYPGFRQLLTLVDSDHNAGFFMGLEDPLDELVTRASVAFYDEFLKDDPTAAQRLDALVGDAGSDVATLQTEGERPG